MLAEEGLPARPLQLSAGRLAVAHTEACSRRLHGLDVRDYQVVGVKSSTHFRAGFAPIVEECGGVILTADEPGLSTNRLEVFEAQRTVASGLGPMWPVDGAAVYEKALAEARL